MNNDEKNVIYLNLFKEVTETLPPLLNYQHFFSISDRNMWNDESLRFDFMEIRSRRNLLTHRGINYDNEYIEKILKSAPSSSNFINPKKRIQFYFEKEFFHIPKLNSIVNNDIKNLINLEKPIPVVITNNYFMFSFSRLMMIYCKLWVYATKSHELLINISHDLIKLGLKYKTGILISLSIHIVEDFIYCFENEDISDLLKANYLLAVRDIKNKHAENEEKKSVFFKYENEFLEYFINKTDVPLYQVLISILGNDLVTAITHLKTCADLPAESKNWVLFTDLLEIPEFDNAFKIATGNNN
jgi:hypothetical protein